MSDLRCAFCHGPHDGADPCPRCGTLVHAECRTSACPTLGCDERDRASKAVEIVAVSRWPLCLLFALLSLCFWTCGGGGVLFHMFRLRHFADHAAIRDAGRTLFARHAPQARPGMYVPVRGPDVPPALADLGDSAFVRVHVDRVEIDIGYYYGLDIWPEGATERGEVLIPGLTIWGGPG